MQLDHVDVAIIGAGNVGIAVAYYLVKQHGAQRITLVDPRDPMSLTSAQSGENYRNWWSHPTMTAFTDHSISLMEALDRESGGRLNMTRGGYVLATRRQRPQDLIDNLYRGYGREPGLIRFHEAAAGDYRPPQRTPWSEAPLGVDVLLDQGLIRTTFPTLDPELRTVLHVRRAGSISAQQMGQVMLEAIRAAGGSVRRAEVRGISAGAPFRLELQSDQGTATLKADRIVNAAGPYLRDIGRMLGDEPPVHNVYQQKISFEDRLGAIPRTLPFTIDLDPQQLAWDDGDRELLQANPATRFLTEPMPGGIHCRPEGAVNGAWVKLGWAYNEASSDVFAEPPMDPHYPDILLRGASRTHAGLKAYIGRLPRGMHHYGGYYTMTPENWPLIGRTNVPGAFIAGALSGFGSMAACATGALCAAWITGAPIPDYARALSGDRHADARLMQELVALDKGAL